MIELVPCTTVGVFGPVASGKTFLFKKWLEKENRVVAFDATGELLAEPGFVEIWASPKKLLAAIEESPYYFKVAYVPGTPLIDDFNWVLKILWSFDAQKLLAVDEFHLVCPNNAIDKDMETLLRFSRHAKLGIIGMSQRIADVHKLFTSACRLTILFLTTEARDLDAIRDRWGDEVKDAVCRLRPLIYDDAMKETRQIPQCVVCRKGAGFQIYDFQTDSFIGKNDMGSSPRQQPIDDEPEPDSPDEQEQPEPEGEQL